MRELVTPYKGIITPNREEALEYAQRHKYAEIKEKMWRGKKFYYVTVYMGAIES